MDAEQLIGAVLRGALTGRRKRSRRTMRYLTGGSGSFINASTIMAAAGVAWGLIEQLTGKDGLAADAHARPGGTSTPGSPGVPPVPGSSPAASLAPLPPVPGAPAAATAAAFPGVPPGVAPAASRMPSHPGVPDAVARVVRLALSAARADGALAPAEQAHILEHARRVGAEVIVEQELRTPTNLDAILAGVSEVKAKEELYTLAFAIVRADESVSGAERIYLAQLAHKLALEPATAARLEAEAAAAIDRTTDSEGTEP